MKSTVIEITAKVLNHLQRH